MKRPLRLPLVKWIIASILPLLGDLVSEATSGAAEPVAIAHRGLLRHAPENTLPAFAACLELRLGFELDVRTTADGHLVVLHDDSLKRTTDGPDAPVYRLTLEQIRRLDAGGWFDPTFSGTQIPTLEEVFQLIEKRRRGSVIVALNVKRLTDQSRKKLVRLVEAYELFEESFAFDQSETCSREMKALDRRFRVGQNVGRAAFARRLEEGLLDVFLVNFVPDERQLAALRAAGKQVLFNDAGPGRRNPQLWTLVRNAALDGLLTDYPLECRSHWRTLRAGLQTP